MKITLKNQNLTLPNGQKVRCAVGRNGVGEKYQEGDGITPVGQWPLRKLYFRKDKMLAPKTQLEMEAITPQMGWCDAPNHRWYNRVIERPFMHGHERLYRDDDIYDLLIPIGFNDQPVHAGKGSAIFLHLTQHDYAPTAGCIALKKTDFKTLLAQISANMMVEIIS